MGHRAPHRSCGLTTSVLGLPGCGNDDPRPLHDQWSTERDRLETLFTHTTLANLAEQITNFDRLELVGETMRFALNALTQVDPEWLRSVAPAEWYERYS